MIFGYQDYSESRKSKFISRACDICGQVSDWNAPPPRGTHRAERVCIKCWFKLDKELEKLDAENTC